MMKQRVREYFEGMRSILKQDEQAVLDSLELDLRKTRSRLDKVLKEWTQHQEQVSKSLSSTNTMLSDTVTAEQDMKVCLSSHIVATFQPLKTLPSCTDANFSFSSKGLCENMR